MTENRGYGFLLQHLDNSFQLLCSVAVGSVVFSDISIKTFILLVSFEYLILV